MNSVEIHTKVPTPCTYIYTIYSYSTCKGKNSIKICTSRIYTIYSTMYSSLSRSFSHQYPFPKRNTRDRKKVLLVSRTNHATPDHSSIAICFSKSGKGMQTMIKVKTRSVFREQRICITQTIRGVMRLGKSHYPEHALMSSNYQSCNGYRVSCVPDR